MGAVEVASALSGVILVLTFPMWFAACPAVCGAFVPASGAPSVGPLFMDAACA
ncbi:hypothetical protein GCM10027162_39550 [Streptomyces incanus]